MLDKDAVKTFIRELERKTNEGLKILTQTSNSNRKYKVRFKLKSISPCKSRFTYNHIENGHTTGCVVIGIKDDGHLGIVESWCNIPQRV